MYKHVNISDEILVRLEMSRAKAGDVSMNAAITRLLQSALDSEDSAASDNELKKWLDERLGKFEHSLRKDNDALLSQSTERISTAAKKINATARQATLATQTSIATLLISGVIAENLNSYDYCFGTLLLGKGGPDLNGLVKIAMAAAQPMTYDKQAFDNIWASMRDIEERAGEGKTLANLFFDGDVAKANDAIRDGGN